MINLPPSWIITKLGDICYDPQYGYTTKASDIGDVKLLRTTDITSGQINWLTVPFCSENPKDIDKLLLNDGDIVISRAGSIGYSMLIEKPQRAVFASYLIRFRPLIYKKYFHNYLKSQFYWKQITEKSLGIAIPNVNATKLKEVDIPLPPLPEQHRIVAKLEELFSQLDIAVAALKKAKEQIKTYKQSVLASAFSGKLTIVNSQLTINEETGLPEGWNFTILEDAVKNLQYGTSDKANENPDGIPVLRMGNIQDGLLDYSNLKYFDKSYSDLNKYLLKEGDVLFNRTNSAELVGKTAVFKKHHPKSVFASYLIKIQVDERKLNPDYLSYYINSIFGREFIKTVVSQNVGQANVNGTKLKSMVLPLPGINEQNDIVVEIETRFSEAENLEKTIDMGLVQAENLRQSILKKAFEGRLVSQDPNDEPAALLLERIKKEKEKINTKVKK